MAQGSDTAPTEDQPDPKSWDDAFSALVNDRLRPTTQLRRWRPFVLWNSVGYASFTGVAAALVGSSVVRGILVTAGVGIVVAAAASILILTYAAVQVAILRHVPWVRHIWAASTTCVDRESGPGLKLTLSGFLRLALSRDPLAPVMVLCLGGCVAAITVGGIAPWGFGSLPTLTETLGARVSVHWLAKGLLGASAVVATPALIHAMRTGAVGFSRPSGALHWWTLAWVGMVLLAVVAGFTLMKSGPVSVQQAADRGALALGSLFLLTMLSVSSLAALGDLGLTRVATRGIPRSYTVANVGGSGPPCETAAPHHGASTATVHHDDALDPARYDRTFLTPDPSSQLAGERPLRRLSGAAGVVDYCWGHYCAGAEALARDLAGDATDDFHVPKPVQMAVLQFVVARHRFGGEFRCTSADIENALAFAGGIRRGTSPPSENA